MSLTREALDKWIAYAKEDLASAPADGMLVYIVENANPPSDDSNQLFTRSEVEIIAVAYMKAMQEYTRH